MKRVDSKTIIAIALIFAGFLSAVVLALIASNKSNYLVASKPLTIGHIVESGDYRVEKASLWSGANQYLTTDISVIGSMVTQFVSENELLTTEMFSNQDENLNYRTVPISVAAADLPTNLASGQSVDIYQVISPNDYEKAKESKLVIPNIRVISIDRRGQNLGNAAQLTLACPENQIIELLNSTRIGRIVVVATTT
jgi:Flp pilus assembly protein CpaB